MCSSIQKHGSCISYNNSNVSFSHSILSMSPNSTECNILITFLNISYKLLWMESTIICQICFNCDIVSTFVFLFKVCSAFVESTQTFLDLLLTKIVKKLTFCWLFWPEYVNGWPSWLLLHWSARMSLPGSVTWTVLTPLMERVARPFTLLWSGVKEIKFCYVHSIFLSWLMNVQSIELWFKEWLDLLRMRSKNSHLHKKLNILLERVFELEVLDELQEEVLDNLF